MSEQVNLHVGGQLQVSSAMPGMNESPLLPGRDPLCLGIGAAAIPGSVFSSGVTLLGSPLSYPLPATPEATLMVARPNVVTNPLASKVPSLFKVTTKANLPPTPLDVMLGDPGIGIVGITVNSLMINILNSTWINIVTPSLTLTGIKNHFGANNKVGAEVRTGVCNETGAKFRAGFSADYGPRKISSVNSVPITKGFIFTGRALKNKKFDISHPTKEGYRLSHVCLEGPTSDVYVRGRLKNKNVIELPEYWSGLVDPDSITVSLTPIGKPDLSLHVKEIIENKIILSSDNLIQANCFYHVYGERKDIEKNIAEYEGESPSDYPGDLKHSSIAGYTYDKEDE
tara:strand:+ start:6528 stop:7550 length:1023 start_codon:yes stop_codon:yes gene_type:complete